MNPRIVNRRFVDMRPQSERMGEHDPSIVEVLFGWSDKHGYCYECGLPAAYVLMNRTREPDRSHNESDLRCSVCAAVAASEGEAIRWLFAEGDAT